jgi:hypothetical protein
MGYANIQRCKERKNINNRNACKMNNIFCHVGYDSVNPVRNVSVFRINMLRHHLKYDEDGVTMFLRNTGDF